MKHALRHVAIAAVAAVAAGILVVPAQGIGSVAAERYIVVLKPGSNPSAVAASHALKFGLETGFVYRSAISGYSAVVPSNRVDELRTDPAVAFLSTDGDVSAAAQTLPTGVNRIEGDLSSTVSGNGSGSAGVAVAVLDTGIDTDHPDLNVVGGVNCSSGRTFEDGHGHGTHVAGTIAGEGRRRRSCRDGTWSPLYAVRVLNNAGSGIVCQHHLWHRLG